MNEPTLLHPKHLVERAMEARESERTKQRLEAESAELRRLLDLGRELVRSLEAAFDAIGVLVPYQWRDPQLNTIVMAVEKDGLIFVQLRRHAPFELAQRCPRCGRWTYVYQATNLAGLGAALEAGPEGVQHNCGEQESDWNYQMEWIGREPARSPAGRAARFEARARELLPWSAGWAGVLVGVLVLAAWPVFVAAILGGVALVALIAAVIDILMVGLRDG